MNPQKAQRLKLILESAHDEFIRSKEIQNDAIEPALQFKKWHDQELVAFICSVLAYGRVAHIKKSVHKIIDPMSSRPHQWLMRASASEIKKLCEGWSHRFNTAQDLEALLGLLKSIYLEFGSLEQFMRPSRDQPVYELIENFVISINGRSDLIKKSASFWFFFPRPSQGSACKRMNLFLRWMVGQGPLNLGLWKSMSTSQLLIPLDVHLLKQAKSLRLTSRKNANWRTAEEITAKLRLLDQNDPTRFDFALCHLGIRGSVLKNI